MSGYANILDIFAEHGIGSRESLEDFLSRNPEVGLANTWHPADFGHSFCETVLDICHGHDGICEQKGIQQFSVKCEPMLSTSSVNKALFLARRSTIFTDDSFSTHTETHDYVSHGGDYEVEVSWRISHDFIRELFTHRAAIDKGYLVILPRSGYRSSRYGDAEGYRDKSRRMSLLDRLRELQATRVFNLGQESKLAHAYIKEYRKNQQLIVLPELCVPWIENLDTPSVLQLRDDFGVSLDRFQSAYHQCTLELIDHNKSLDFAKISKQIVQDIVTPRLDELERDYKRAISLHAKLRNIGASVVLAPVIGVILRGDLISRIARGELADLLVPALAGLVGVYAANRIQNQHEMTKYEDDTYYLLWRLGKDKVKRNK